MQSRLSNSDSSKITLLILLATVLVGGLLRAYFLFQNSLIGVDSVTYVELGLNLIQGRGYTASYVLPHPELIKAPLYPALTGIAWTVVGDGFLAAKTVSFVLGTLLVFPVYALGNRIYDRTVGITAALLVSVHPLLISISSTALADATYTFLITTTALIAYITFRRESFKWDILLGALLGICFLSKHVAFGYLAIASLVILSIEYIFRSSISDWAQKSMIRIAVVGVAFFIVASPYLLFLYQETGAVTFGGKSSINLIIGEKVTSSEPFAYQRIAYGLTEDSLQRTIATFPEISTSEYIFSRPRETIQRYAINLSRLSFSVLPRAIYPIYLLLIGLGLFGRLWEEKRTRDDFYLVLWVGYPLITLPLFFLRERFIAPILPVLMIWAALGLQTLQEEVTKMARRYKSTAVNTDLLNAGLVFLTVLLLLISYVDPAIGSGGEPIDRKVKGEWLKEHSDENATLMVVKPSIAYYADRDYISIPFADLPDVIRYGCFNQADYLVITKPLVEAKRPQLTDLLNPSNVPEENLTLVYNRSKGMDTLIYKIHCSSR